jgi:hypothetical protein
MPRSVTPVAAFVFFTVRALRATLPRNGAAGRLSWQLPRDAVRH